jgi:hypothetical protein
LDRQLTSEEQEKLEELTTHILKSYSFRRPPVPIEEILREPPDDLIEAVDLSDLSMVFGVGEHQHEYRMAMARLLYREICRQGSPNGEDLPYNREASRYFAVALLIPQSWVDRATLWPWATLQKLSEKFEVPEYVMAARLAQLGKDIKGMQ